MADTRKTDNPRTNQFVLKLTQVEMDGLKRLSQANYRTPGDMLRFLLAEALKAEGGRV